MKKALVLGATGGMGYSIVKELAQRGVKVVAFARTEEKLKKMFGAEPNVIIQPGDAFQLKQLESAANGIDIIFQAINLPYADWKQNLIPLNEKVIRTARNFSARIAVVDNIYAYGRSNGKKISETTPKSPNTRKGKLRLEMENLYKQSGVPYVIAHFPDFYGPYAENGQLNYLLRDITVNKKARFIGKQGVLREHIYTPDGARAIVELALREEAYGECWNIPAYDVISGEEIIQIAREMTGYKKQVGIVTRNMLRFLGLFDKQMREFAEMQYLAEEPVVLDGRKYEERIGPVPRTAYVEGLRKTIDSYRK
ncbi:SDR family NAD(P)-dependent oxidoreductase [Oceanobacillus indicireducens]|uniref:NAD-dependent epimerase n=1 Tax=Oceanobacillus indicireducens TaxID=1004261 RepID=A0A918D4Y6_9BACI|nr:SDR family NAD(P)-dependent oxidoreductase [Oceanobacillus indicireducens]GGN65959.1 NAD-dependent epimerase [Oceanobacillus indicireducens]